MTKRLALGVKHKTKEEYAAIREHLSAFQPRYLPSWMPDFFKPAVGLELPRSCESIEMRDVYFLPLAREMKEAGFCILPLEDCVLRRKFRIAEMARKVVRGELERAELEQILYLERKILDEITSYYDPQYVLAKKEHVQFYDEALRLSDEGKDAVEYCWLRRNAAREKFMLTQIEMHRPRAVILGKAHVVSLHEAFEQLGYELVMV